MLSETIAELERLYNTANDSDFAKEVQVMAGQKLADLFWFNAPALLAAAKLSEARARVCEAAEDVSSSATMKADAGRGLICAVSRLSMRALKDAIVALAAAEKGSA